MLDERGQFCIRLLLHAQEMCFDPLHHAVTQRVGLGELCRIPIELCTLQSRLHQGIVVHDLVGLSHVPLFILF